MSLTTDQSIIQRGTRVLAREAKNTAKKGVEWDVDHTTTPSTISLWDVGELGAEPNEATIRAKAEEVTIKRHKAFLRSYAEDKITEDFGILSIAVDAMRLAQLTEKQRSGLTLTGAETTQLDNLMVGAADVRKYVKAKLDVINTIVYEDTAETMKAKYDAEIA